MFPCPFRVIHYHSFSVLSMATTNTHDVDTGHAWLILFANSCVLFLSEGLRKALSVILPTLKDQFETHTWLIGIMIALMHGVKDFVGKLQFDDIKQPLTCLK